MILRYKESVYMTPSKSVEKKYFSYFILENFPVINEI